MIDMLSIVVFLTFVIRSKAQTLPITLQTNDPCFGGEVKLYCQVASGCCSGFARRWDAPPGTNILNDGNPSDASKYAEEYDGGTTGFNLIIKNLQNSDLGKQYKCEYGLEYGFYTLSGNFKSCPSSDECEYGKCAGWDFMYSSIGTLTGTVVAVIYCVVKKIPGSKVIKIVGGTFGISNVINVIVAVPIGLKVCHCTDGTAPAFIVLGVGGSIIIFVILKNILCKNQGDPQEESGPKPEGRLPTNTKHIKTENNMTLSEKTPLPGIVTPRPLPMLELGKPQKGPILEPLNADSMMEKKKKKKKKKKSEESDDE